MQLLCCALDHGLLEREVLVLEAQLQQKALKVRRLLRLDTGMQK